MFMRALRLSNCLLVLAVFYASDSTATARSQDTSIQQLFGKVTDAESGLPITGVQVFYSGTTIGDVTDQGGIFELPTPPVTRIIVVFSMLGYEVLSVVVNARTRQSGELNIALKTSIIGLDGVIVSADRDTIWEQNLKRFEDVLFSNTSFGKSCWIDNAFSVILNYDTETEILSATASEPLIIINPKLGYRVTLHDFSLGSRGARYHWEGAPQFEELDSDGGKKTKGWYKNRRKAYYGSARHLLKSFIDADLKKSGFYVYYVFDPGHMNKDFPVAELISTELDTLEISERTIIPTSQDGLFLFQPHRTLYVQYGKEAVAREFDSVRAAPRYYRTPRTRVQTVAPLQLSWIDITVGSLFVDYNGNLLVEGAGFPITTYGYMAWERLGELLPFDYNPDSDD